MSSLEIIEYLENTMYQILAEYKRRKYPLLNTSSLWITIRKIFEITKDIKVKPQYRKKAVLKTLVRMTSDQYIESNINWTDYNILNTMIDSLNLSDIEQEVIKDETCRCCL